MPNEERVQAEPCAGAFTGCLVDGDATENARERKVKRRAIGISILLQTVGLAVLVMAPLFAKQPELIGRNVVPIPPYRHQAPGRSANPTPPTTPPKGNCLVCAMKGKPPKGSSNGAQAQISNQPPDDGVLTTGESDDSQIKIFDVRPQPIRPADPPHVTQRVHEPAIHPALLTRRIEPVYPPLARQLRRSGKVELHAIIATDGSIQELQAVSGDPLFINSALAAVRQWHYKPAYLNGQLVEIDTYITVIYTLQQ